MILSHTGAYFLINSSFPSKRSKVPVKHKINLYLTTLKIVENEGLAKVIERNRLGNCQIEIINSVIKKQ